MTTARENDWFSIFELIFISQSDKAKSITRSVNYCVFSAAVIIFIRTNLIRTNFVINNHAINNLFNN